jgi:cytochrome c-type biogenesis protein CcmH/NrfG
VPILVPLALAALALGVPAFVFAAWPLLGRRTGSARLGGPVPDDPRARLEADKVQALMAIRELDWDRQAGLLPEADYTAMRVRCEAQASAILLELDALPPPAPEPVRARPPVPASTPRPAAVSWTQRPLVLAGGAVGLLLFGIALGGLAVRHTAPAPAEPQAAMSGATLEAAPDAAPGGPGAVRPIPGEMLAGMLRAAHQSLDAGRYQEAIAAYKAVLKREPQNVEAITHLGLILALAGHTDGALEALDRALAIDPDYAHALWDKARVLSDQRQDYAGAIAAWERFVKVGPPGSDRDQALARIREAKARLAGGGLAPRPAAPAAVKP